MYVVRYQHGTLTSERMGSQRADLTFGNILRVLTQDHTYKLVRYSPHNAWFVCDRPSHVARLDADHIPCVVLTIQQERGSIPVDWPTVCPQCGHLHDTQVRCLCTCHIS